MLENYESVASLAEVVEELDEGFQGFSVEKAKDQDSRRNFEDGDRPQSQEGNHADQRRDNPILSQGGGFCEVPVHKATEKIEGVHVNQRILSRQNEHENVAFGKTSTWDEQWTEGNDQVHELLPEKEKNGDLKGTFWNQGKPEKQTGSHMAEKRDESIPDQGWDCHKVLESPQACHGQSIPSQRQEVTMAFLYLSSDSMACEQRYIYFKEYFIQNKIISS
uniref:Uncharacterized protein n=1 Tax=Sphaerodactylus townsendi TaxID=933632 RepID=A0ACB8G7G5_9SAUR